MFLLQPWLYSYVSKNSYEFWYLQTA